MSAEIQDSQDPTLEQKERAIDPDSDLIVTVVGANNLPAAKNGSADPLVSISVFREHQTSHRTQRTRFVKEKRSRWRSSAAINTLNPTWELHNVFAARVFTSKHHLRIRVLDKERFVNADALSAVQLSFAQLKELSQHVGEVAIPLQSKQTQAGQPESQLRLIVSFPRLNQHRNSLRESEGPYEAIGHTPEDPVYFVFNGKEHEGATKPAALRTCRSEFKPELVAECQQLGLPLPSRAGLDELKISGSAQFGRVGLEAIIAQVVEHGATPEFIVVCDLRGEPHMVLNGLPVSWYNRGDKLGANLPPVECDELTRTYVRSLLKRRTVHVRKVLEKGDMGLPAKTEAVRIEIQSIETEEMLVHREFNLGYSRVPINDHESPEVRDADQLVGFYQSSPRGTWWHFHCAGGKGRTTTAMVLIDMLRNRHSHPDLTVQDFVLRQWLIGGINLDVSEEPSQPGSAWKHRDAQIRREFLRVFFQYTRDADAHAQGLMFFSTWLRQNNITWPPIFPEDQLHCTGSCTPSSTSSSSS